MGIGGNKGNKRHLILGQSSSLVRADYSDTAKGLNSWELPDDGIVLGHVGNTPAVSHGHNGIKTFRDHGNSTDKSNGNGIKSFFPGNKVGNTPGDN